MPKYKITYDTGYGPTEEEIEADNEQDAESHAYELAKEEFESNLMYSAEEIGDENDDE